LVFLEFYFLVKIRVLHKGEEAGQEQGMGTGWPWGMVEGMPWGGAVISCSLRDEEGNKKEKEESRIGRGKKKGKKKCGIFLKLENFRREK
jgi:hypothetical protein